MRSQNTRSAKKEQKKTRKAQKPKIQHHHFLLRMETEICPLENDKDMATAMIQYIVHNIKMKLLAEPHVYYVKYPRYNEGLTAIAPIETSHIAFHFWRTPDKQILHNPESRCLLQMDIYTCGSLTMKNIQKILHHLTKFQPTHISATLLNRNYALSIQHQTTWDKSEKSWDQCIASFNGIP